MDNLNFRMKKIDPVSLDEKMGVISKNYLYHSLGILDLIRKLLAKHRHQRIKLTELQRHPWILQKPINR